MTENNDHLFGQGQLGQLRGLSQTSSGAQARLLYKTSDIGKVDIFT